jgi:hypothetical protein
LQISYILYSKFGIVTICPRVWIGTVNHLLEGPTRDIDDVVVVHVPAAFPRQVRNDPVGDAEHLVGLLAIPLAQLPFLHSRRELLCCHHLQPPDFLLHLRSP